MIDIGLAAELFPHRKEDRFIDTAADRKYGEKKGDDVLREAHNAWASLDKFRDVSERNKRYTFGDQLADKVRVGHDVLTERDYILQQGNVPLQNNRIRGIVRSVTGLFLSAQTEPVCVARERDKQTQGEIMSATMQYVYQNNKMKSIDLAAFRYFMVAGVPVYKSVYALRNGQMDVWTDIINLNRFFFDTNMQDVRTWDVRLVGELHDLGLYDVMDKFSGGDKEKALWIKQLYNFNCRDKDYVNKYSNELIDTGRRRIDFFIPQDDSRCRVIEVWRKESKERLLVHDTFTGSYDKFEIENQHIFDEENARRQQEWSAQGVAPEDMRLIEYKWFIDNYWYYYYLTPTGEILSEGETPYWHESHPYTFAVYPYYDGEVHSFVSDFIDQQRYINRLIMMQDFLMRASAKGVLMIPEDSIPEGMTADDIAEQWVKFNGVIVYKAKPGVTPPAQISANTTQLGVYDMLSMQLKLLEDISGVSGVLQGQTPASGTAATLYMQQTQNASTSLTELLEEFKSLREARDKKNMQLVQQFYKDMRYVNPTGKSGEAVMYDPKEVRDVEFDLSLSESTATPAYRMIMNDFLLQMFQAGALGVKEVLENGAFPFADKLLQSINAKEQQMQQQQAAMQAGALNDPQAAQMQQAATAEGAPIVDPSILSTIQSRTVLPQG